MKVKKQVEYLNSEIIIEYNFLALMLISVKKADTHVVLSHEKISEIVEGCITKEGDIYDKAAYLFKDIIQKHPFASGNRRTAFIATKSFLLKNRRKFNIDNDPKQAQTMLGIRAGYFQDNEIKGWIQNGPIREFKRFE